MFTRAIVRPPAHTFADGLTTSGLGSPDLALALEQHAAYCDALRACGLTLVSLPPDPGYPDSTFVEDTAIVTQHGAMLTRPGAPSRAGEVAAIRAALASFFSVMSEIVPPGTVDGGDICEAGSHVFIGISDRTSEEGAQQLASFLEHAGFTSSTIDIRGRAGLLHLKSGLSALNERQLVVTEALSSDPALRGYTLICTESDEDYAANCISVNDFVLVAQGYPALREALHAHGHRTIDLDMSEYRKMDGGLSCLSLRF